MLNEGWLTWLPSDSPYCRWLFTDDAENARFAVAQFSRSRAIRLGEVRNRPFRRKQRLGGFARAIDIRLVALRWMKPTACAIRMATIRH